MKSYALEWKAEVKTTTVYSRKTQGCKVILHLKDIYLRRFFTFSNCSSKSIFKFIVQWEMAS